MQNIAPYKTAYSKWESEVLQDKHSNNELGERIEGWRGPWKLAGKRICGGWEPIIHAGHCKTNDYRDLAGNNYWGLSVDYNKLQNSALSKGGNHSSVAANSCLVGIQSY